MLAQTLSASLLGVEGVPVRVEVDVAFGLPSLTIVGMAGSQVQEARERVRSALRNSGFEVPARRITVNLAPADLPKDGTAYDVAIAVGILAASGQLPDASRLTSTALLGELALDGAVRPVTGVMSLVAAAQAAGIGSVVVAAGDEAEAACVAGIDALPAERLVDVVAHLAGLARRGTSSAMCSASEGVGRRAGLTGIVTSHRAAKEPAPWPAPRPRARTSTSQPLRPIVARRSARCAR
jgi:magnesium chelatase family protein